jgi:hypothetical protein
MTTEKQILANRINALKGGVKTQEGRAKVRFNAVSHGFFAKELVLPGEDQHLLEKFCAKLTAEVKPQSEMENLFLELIVSATWKIKRILNFEKKNSRVSSNYRDPTPDKVIRHVNTLERQIYKAIRELEKIRKERIQNSPVPTYSSFYGVEIPSFDGSDTSDE